MLSGPMTAPTTLQAFLFTDLVGSTQLKRDLGDERGAAAIARHDELFRSCLTEFGGLEQNNPGDGFFATFDVPSSAVRCALAFQSGLRELDHPLKARVGIHVGESSLVPGAKGQPDKLLGLAVDIAGRVMSLACANQILLTRHAFDAARQHVLAGSESTGLAWRAHGPYLLSGIDEPVEIFETGLDGHAPLEAPADSAKARRSIRPGEEETLGWRPAIGLEVPGRAGWLLEKKLGEGGFGEIWLVRNVRTREDRAFKFCFHADRLRSLKRELTLFRLIKQTLGNRPDISRLYEVRFDEAPYFLEMEYTSGGSLDQWFDAQVPLATRLELMAQVADALAAAHSVGVIHKDVKPSNVLVDTTDADRPRARLTDFGIGQLVDRNVLDDAGVTGDGFDGEPTLLTDMASRTGTRLYMAPELLTGRPATIASDVYAAGVMLYQLVVGDLARPLAQGWESDIDDALLREDIAACIAGSAAARLPSADLLSTRLRTLDERRRERERARDLVRRDARRRRFFRVSLAASAVLLLVAGASLVGYVRAEAAEARAHKRFEEVRGLANAVLFEFDDQLRDLPGSLPARRLLVERALQYLDRLPSDESDAGLEFALERARGYVKVAGVQGTPGRPNLGDRDGALANLSKALSIIEPLNEQQPGTREIESALAETLLDRGALLTMHSRDDDSSADLDRALVIMEGLIERYPEDTSFRVSLARALSSKGAWLHYGDSDRNFVKPYFERAITVLRRLQEAGRLGRHELQGFASTYSNFGGALTSMGRQPMELDPAFEAYAHERAILEGLEGGRPGDLQIELALVRNYMRTGRICYFQNRYPDAVAWYAKAQKRTMRLLALYPNDLRTRRFCANGARRQAQVHNRTGDTQAALEQYVRGIAVLTELPAGTMLSNQIYRERAVLHEAAAEACVKLDRLDEARTQFECAVSDFQQTFAPDSNDIYRIAFYPLACVRVAQSLQAVGDDDAALAYMVRMDAAFTEAEEQDSVTEQVHQRAARARLAFAEFNRGRGENSALGTSVRQGALRDAITTYGRVLKVYETYPGIGGDVPAVTESLTACERALAQLK